MQVLGIEIGTEAPQSSQEIFLSAAAPDRATLKPDTQVLIGSDTQRRFGKQRVLSKGRVLKPAGSKVWEAEESMKNVAGVGATTRTQVVVLPGRAPH